MYDLLLKGGTVVDPSQELHGVHDIAVQDGKIANIAPGIATEEATQVIDVSGRIVTPGLIEFSVFQSTQKSTVLMGGRFGCDRNCIDCNRIRKLQTSHR